MKLSQHALLSGAIVVAATVGCGHAAAIDQATFELGDGAIVALATAGGHAFRVSVSYGGTPAGPLATPMVHPVQQNANFTKVTDGAWQGIKTTFGAAYVSQAGGFRLDDASGSSACVHACVRACVRASAGPLAPCPPACVPACRRACDEPPGWHGRLFDDARFACKDCAT